MFACQTMRVREREKGRERESESHEVTEPDRTALATIQSGFRPFIYR